MTNDRRFLNNKLIVFLILTILIVTVAVAFGYQLSKKETGTQVIENTRIDNSLSKLVLNVSDMSCSGCVSTIKGSLSDFEGIGDILVDVGRGRTEVYFDPGKLTDITRIEKAITESGYPAKIQKVVSAGEIKKEMDIASEKSKVYVVSVGGYEIARADFDTEITVAKKKYEKLYGDDVFMSAQGDTLMGKLKAQVISRLIEEGVFMQEISRSGYKVSDDKVEDELKKFYETSGKSEETFRKTLDETGYSYDYFKNKFVTRVLINSYIDERVLAEAFNQFEKQNLFNAWFENSKVLAEVVYYDKGLENLIRNQSASGGSCSAN